MKVITAPALFSAILLASVTLCASISFAQLETRPFSGFSNQPKPLPPEQAFPFYVSVISPKQLKIVWNPADEHYLYRHAFNFSMTHDPDSTPLNISYKLPSGLKKNDQFFGDIEAYYEQIEVDLSLSTAAGPNAVLLISYQGCADWGFCYPPQNIKFQLTP